MINICYLLHDRMGFSELTFYFLNKIKKENKKKIKLSILTTNSIDLSSFNLEGIIIDVKTFNGSMNYLNKIKYAVNVDSEYSIKLDEDCFINNYVWDYIIENINVLDNLDNLLLSPVMTNNIPSCDLFIEEYIEDKSVKNSIYNHFLNREMPNGLWGVDYTALNENTIYSDVWNAHEFYANVSKLNTDTKGIHPLRISYEAQLEINEYILNNLNRFLSKNEYSIIEFDAPYFTNSLFAIKTDVWKDILSHKSVDGYDEIALNIYKSENSKKLLFIRNGFGIHPMYNTVFGDKNKWNIGVHNGQELETLFYNQLIKKIKLR